MSGNDNIPKGWVETKLGNHLKVGRGSSPRPIHKYISTEGIPWVKIADASASNNKYIEKTKEFIIEEGRSTSVKPVDLIVSNSATPGIPKFMAIDACVHDGWLVFSEYNGIDKLYLYYFFLFFRRKLNHSATGTVFKNLKIDIVRNIELLLPPLPEQQAIASILTSFDDKIELLQAQNQTLEATAQTIFKEWFGKYQVGDELPEGWRVGKYQEIVELSSGKGIKKSEYVDNGKYDIIGANGSLGKLDKFLIDEKIIITGRVGTLGTVFIINKPAWISDNVLISKPKNNYLFHFTYFTLNGFNFTALNTGSTQPLITQSALKSVKIIIPNEADLQSFEKISSKIFQKIEDNQDQIQTLEQTRNTLLPKLMSGKLRVEEFCE